MAHANMTAFMRLVHWRHCANVDENLLKRRDEGVRVLFRLREGVGLVAD